jgi:ASC-1-like (ASCH) protein
MNHQMKLNPNPYEQIESGIKDLEIRLYDEKRQQIKVGDTITFKKLPDLNQEITKKVIGYVVFKDFITLFNNVEGVRAGWKVIDTPESMAKNMEKYYSIEKQQQFGVMGIFLG